jgi:hypothetical protein
MNRRDCPLAGVGTVLARFAARRDRRRPSQLMPRFFPILSSPSLGRVWRALLCAGVVLHAGTTLTACTTHYIPNTDVEDTEENRKIVAFAEKYRHAVEHKDVAALVKMASPSYYEDGGNVDASDDIDYAGLRDYLTTRFEDASAIRYEIRYRRIVKEDDKIFLDYTYTASYRIPGDKGDDVWRRKVEDNRLELVPYQDDFRIVNGM